MGSDEVVLPKQSSSTNLPVFAFFEFSKGLASTLEAPF